MIARLTPARLVAIATLALGAALAAGLGWLLLTPAGLARALVLVESLDAVEIRVSGATGRLAGPLRLERLSVATDRVAIEATDVELDYAPAGLLFGRLRVAAVSAAAVVVDVRPDEEPSPPDRPRFLPRWLAVDVESLGVAQVTLTRESSTLLEARDLRARGTLTHARLVLDEAALDAGFFSAAGSLELTARQPLGLAGSMDWTLGRGREAGGRLEARGDLARLTASLRVADPVEGTLRVTLEDLAGKPGWRAEGEFANLDLAAYLDAPPIGPLAGRVAGSGSFDAALVEAGILGAGLPAAGVELTAHLRREDGGVLRFDVLDLAAPGIGAAVEARGRLDLGEVPALALEADWRGLRWPLEGEAAVSSARGQLRLAGWTAFEFELEGSVATPVLPAVEVGAAGRLDGLGLDLASLRATGPPGRVDARGFVGFGEALPWRLEADVSGLDVGQIASGLDSRLAFRLVGSGSGTGDGFAFAGAVTGLAGTLRGQPARGSGLLRYRPGRLDFDQVELQLGPAQFVADGWLGEDTRLIAQLRADDLAGFAPGLAGRVEMRLEARAVAAPTRRGDLPALLLDLSLRGRDLAFGEERAAVLSADALVDLTDSATSWARLRAAGITLGGQTVNSTRISLDGFAREHRFEFQVGAGERAVDLEGAGAFVDGVYRLTASRVTAAGPDVAPWSLEAPLQLTASARSAELGQACFVHDGRRVCLQAGWRSGERWSAALGTQSFPLQALDVSLPGQPGYSGLLDLDVALEGRAGQPWTGRSVLRLRDAVFSYVAPSGRQEQLVLGATELVADSEPQQHRVVLNVRDTDAVRLDGEARIERRPGLALAESPIAGQLQLETRQLGLLPLLVHDIDRAAGLLRADLAVTGLAGTPQFAGRMTLEDGSLEFYQTNLRMSELGARLDLTDNLVRLDLGGRIGEGRFGVDGLLGWQERLLSGQVNFKGERLLVADLPELSVEASPDLAFRLDGRRIGVSGSVTVPRARIEPRQFTGAVVASADEVITDGEAGDPADRYLVSTDIRLVLGREVRLDAFGLKGRLEGDVRLLARPDEVPIASGELEVEDAKYRAYTKELEVERGRLLFAGGPVADPGVDLRALQKLPGYEVGVLVRGRLRQPELTLYSSPSLPQSQIASLLLVGRSLDALQSGDREALGSSTDLATQGGALLAGQLGRYLGLDEVGVEADAGNEAALVIGKFLSPRLYVSYGISLADAINTFKLRYTIGDRWVIRGESGRESSADVEFTIER